MFVDYHFSRFNITSDSPERVDLPFKEINAKEMHHNFVYAHVKNIFTLFHTLYNYQNNTKIQAPSCGTKVYCTHKCSGKHKCTNSSDPNKMSGDPLLGLDPVLGMTINATVCVCVCFLIPPRFPSSCLSFLLPLMCS